MFEWLKRSTSWQPSHVTGGERVLKSISAGDTPVSTTASWNGTELVVRCEEAGSIALFDVPLPNVEQCRITYRFRITAADLKSAVYPEMWVRLPERGLFFSRGVDRKIKGPVEGAAVEIPFFLERGQRADFAHLNLACEGPVVVRLADFEIGIADVAAR